MKILFVYPDYFTFPDGSYQPEARFYFGLAYLSAFLKESGHETSLIHLVKPTHEEEFIDLINQESPNLIAFSTTTHMFPKVKTLAQWVKKHTRIPTICGGVHPTIDPEETGKTEGIDMICLGEGEEALLELADKMSSEKKITNIRNIWVKQNNNIVRNKVRPLVENLDLLPFPDRSIFDKNLLSPEQKSRGAIMASRGCPYNCAYCSNHIQKSIYPNKKNYVRFKSVGRIIDEIKDLIARDNDVEFIRFDDDILTLKEDWFEQLMTRYAKEINLPFICNARANLLDEKNIKMLAQAGCKTVAMGIESGNKWIREKILHRYMSNQKIINTFQLCKKYGMKTVSTNIIGLPFETLEMVMDTIRLNALCEPDFMQVSIFFPYPGTRLKRICEENNLLVGIHYDSIFQGYSVKNPEFEKPLMTLAHQNFSTLVNLYEKCHKISGSQKEANIKKIEDLFFNLETPENIRLKELKKIINDQKKLTPLKIVNY